VRPYPFVNFRLITYKAKIGEYEIQDMTNAQEASKPQFGSTKPDGPSAPARKESAPVFLAVLAVLFTTGFSLQHFAHVNDLFWQIRCGQEILENGTVPHFDTYSWTRHGTPWNVNEWLFFVLLAKAFAATGNLTGIFLVSQAAGALLALICFVGFYRRTGSGTLAFGLVALVISNFSNFSPRPYLASFLFFAVTTYLLAEVSEARLARHWLWALPPLFAVWANLHQGVVEELAVLILVIAGALSWGCRGRHGGGASLLSRELGLYALPVALCGFLATLLTPYRFGLYAIILKTIRDPGAMARVTEWQPLPMQMDLHGLAIDALFFLTLAAVALDLCRRPLAASTLGYLAVFALLTVEALLHRRNVPYFALGVGLLYAPAIARLVACGARWPAGLAWFQSKLGRGFQKTWPVLLTLHSVVIGFLLICAAPPMASTLLENTAAVDLSLTEFPQEAPSFMSYTGFPPGMRLFNDFNLGGFLILSRPTDLVFVDGRIDVYAGPFMDSCLALNQPGLGPLTPANRRFLGGYDFDAAVTQNPDAAYYFATRPDFALVYVNHFAPIFDDRRQNCWIFVRRRPEYQDLIDRCLDAFQAHNGGRAPDAELPE